MPQELLEMLTYKRPGGSKTERAFIERYIAPLGATPDRYGNYWLSVGPNPTLLFSSHTDTVHHDEGFQKVLVDGDGIATAEIYPNGVRGKKLTNCLGADCTTGVWLMMEMIRAGVEGVYVFHREEESGGNGSLHVAKHEPERLEGIRAAIAFDRKGYGSIITHQMYGRCCSEAFAETLSDAIGLDMISDDGGTFTDTANYTHLIGECTNISVGYFGQHGPAEAQDLNFALQLRDALICADFSNLLFEREPSEDGGSIIEWDYKPGRAHVPFHELTDLLDMIYDYPETAARLLESIGITAEDLLNAFETEDPVRGWAA
jgi:hypothetical protein